MAWCISVLSIQPLTRSSGFPNQCQDSNGRMKVGVEIQSPMKGLIYDKQLYAD
jgi:hypothetical protein